MALLRPSVSLSDLRRSGRLLSLAPLVSLLLIIVGVAWLLLLPLDDYSRKTYISENALLPGQVHTYFGGSEHNIFRAYREEVYSLGEVTEEERIERLSETLRSSGLKVATQSYHYEAAGNVTSGTNVYAILQGPRADATEAVVLIGAWKNMDGEVNYSGMALVLTLARYFKRWSLWSKDIIFLLSADSVAGPTAWVDAYHDAHSPAHVQPLTLKSGALQGGIAVDYPAGPWGHRFDKIHVVYDGINGMLPNLDLINTAVNIAQGQVGVDSTFQAMWDHQGGYRDRLQTMLRGMLKQGVGVSTGPHSAFLPYHVDAITLQTVGDGWHDEMSLGKVVESIFRSLNNLLEHLHQSFFFYLLMDTKIFVSIGTYLPAAMIVAANFSIMAIVQWVKSGRPASAVAASAQPKTEKDKKGKAPEKTSTQSEKGVALPIEERHMFLPLAFVGSVHFLGLLPLYIFNHSSASLLTFAFATFTTVSSLAPHATTLLLTNLRTPTHQELTLIHCFSLLLLGMFLSALATLNFSLSFLVGLLSTPITFIAPTRNKPIAAAQLLLLHIMSPMVVGVVASWAWSAGNAGAVGQEGDEEAAVAAAAAGGIGAALQDVLAKAAFGWHVSGLWTQVVVWLVWWPAWFASMVVVGCGAL